MFKYNGSMIAVQVERIRDSYLDLVSCDLKYRFDNVSKDYWIKQVNLMRTIQNK